MTPSHAAYNAESHPPTDSGWCNQCREDGCTCNPVTLDEVLEREYERDANRQRPPINVEQELLCIPEAEYERLRRVESAAINHVNTCTDESFRELIKSVAALEGKEA